MIYSISLGLVIGLVNAVISYFILKQAIKQPPKLFIVYMLGGMGIRMAIILGIVLLIVLLAKPPEVLSFFLALCLSVLGGIFYDAFAMSKHAKATSP